MSISRVKAPCASSLTSSSKRYCISNVVSHDCVSMCTKKDYRLHCHLLGDHNIHKHLILCLHLAQILAPLVKSSITDQISFLIPESMSLRQNCLSIAKATEWMDDFHRHHLFQRDPKECLHNLQPKSGCVLTIHPLLEAKCFCHSP